MRTAGDLMTAVMHTVDELMTVTACRELMIREHLRHVPVVDRSGVLVGLANDLELIQAERDGLGKRWVTEVCSTVERPLQRTDQALPALARMLVEHRPALVVTDAQTRPIGVFTEHDALELARVVLIPWETVGELAQTHQLLSVTRDVAAHRALSKMREHRVRHLLILDEGRLEGVLSHVDLVARDYLPVERLGAMNPHVVRRSTPLSHAIETMLDHRIGLLPVLDEDAQVVSVITRTDILRALARQLLHASSMPEADPG